VRYTFVAIIVESAEGGYIGYIEELPGAVARGCTVDDALAALRQEADVILATNRRMTWEPFRDAPEVKRTRIVIES
jgi:predicted RNase H-like HicB family nuclease